MRQPLKDQVQQLLSLADVQVNGSRPWDIKVHNDQLYRRVISQGSLGLGEAYMDRWWSAENLEEFFYRVLVANLKEKVGKDWRMLLHLAVTVLLNLQNRSRAYNIGKRHYDIGNDLYQAMLDQRMVYTCAYWKNAKTLDAAQEAKLDLVCRKVGLKEGQRVLDIGCGWGSFAKFAAQNYGVEVVGITVSKEQVKLGTHLCKGLPIELRLQDYRDVHEKFDHVVSLGMFEHVGYKNYRTYMKIVRRCLKDEGLFLLQTIGGNESVRATDPWFDKYIFPDGMLPSSKQISASTEGVLIQEDVHNFGYDYHSTLMAWYDNFKGHRSLLQKHYDERFFRMWEFYLLSSAALFRARRAQLWQIVFSPQGVPGGYPSIR